MKDTINNPTVAQEKMLHSRKFLNKEEAQDMTKATAVMNKHKPERKVQVSAGSSTKKKKKEKEKTNRKSVSVYLRLLLQIQVLLRVWSRKFSLGLLS